MIENVFADLHEEEAERLTKRLNQIDKLFDSDEKSIAFLGKVRWKEKITCIKCNSDKIQNNNYIDINCLSCNHKFTATDGTIFDNTILSLNIYFLILPIILENQKSIAICKTANKIGIRRSLLWSMIHRVRKTIGTEQEVLIKNLAKTVKNILDNS